MNRYNFEEVVKKNKLMEELRNKLTVSNNQVFVSYKLCALEKDSTSDVVMSGVAMSGIVSALLSVGVYNMILWLTTASAVVAGGIAAIPVAALTILAGKACSDVVR